MKIWANREKSMCKDPEESMCLLEALKIVHADLRLKEAEDGEGCSYKVSMKSLVSQERECVLHAQSNWGSGALKSFKQRSGMIRESCI